MDIVLNLAYIVASVLFIVGIKRLSSPDTAVGANYISMCGMGLAIVATLFDSRIDSDKLPYILGVVALGAVIGTVVSQRVQMTSIPEMVAIFNGFGGLASMLVAMASLQIESAVIPPIGLAVSLVLALVIGAVTFSGSMVAYLKLSERISGSPFIFKGLPVVSALVVIVVLGAAAAVIYFGPSSEIAIILVAVIVALALLFGVLGVMPIGGADMPVVIALLNSYSGLAAAAAGFVVANNLLIVAGSMVGASGLILTSVMCRAMNRSLLNVLISGFSTASASSAAGADTQGEYKAASILDAWAVLEAANSVVVVPGYGMAVAQAQHLVQELALLLEDHGTEVRYGIHPVAGRMPGHMNVLLAEANVPYEQLVEPDDVNPTMESVDVAIVIGANDVVNPSAKHEEGSPIYGMPIIEVDRSKTVFILKRSMASGFAGIQNPLFFNDNSRMLFGDAKETLSALVAEFKN